MAGDEASATDGRRVEGLLRVLEVTRDLATVVELGPLLGRVADAALAVLDCERASVFLHDAPADELVSLVATGGEEVRFPAGTGIAGEAFRTGRVLDVADAYADPRFNPEVDRRTGFVTRNLLTCPLAGADGRPLGVLQALNKRGGPFDAGDAELAGTLGAQAGVAIQRQFLMDAFAEKQRIEREIELARTIQQGLLPREAPRVRGFDVAGWCRPADRTGGDFFDFAATPEGDLAITLADVAGHGIGPALVVVECRALIRAALGRAGDGRVGPDALIGRVNDFLCDDLPPDRFVTAFFGLLRPADGALRHVSAGHGPILFFEAATGEIRELEAQGPPLAVVGGFPYGPPGTLAFAPGDLLAAFTDGFFEWTDPDGQPFGVDRLKDLIRRDRDRPSAQIIVGFYEEVLAFARGRPQPDDLTAVVVKRG